MNAIGKQVTSCEAWRKRLPAERWLLYQRVITAGQERRVPFAIGGGLAMAMYTGQWRDTKDIDLYVRPNDRDVLIQITVDAGLRDYYERQPYDRSWIHRRHGCDTIVDIIWSMANRRADVDEDWLSGPKATIGGLEVQFVPVDLLLWSKLYVVQHDRCDWPDAMNLVYAAGSDLDWSRLLGKLELDSQLLGALLATFRWLCPPKAAELPDWLWYRVGLCAFQESDRKATANQRANLLDTRPWFIPTIENEQSLFHPTTKGSAEC